jgi:hypothetical protein
MIQQKPIKLGITQVAETNPRAKGADPQDFVDGRLLREIEASGFVKRLYGEQEKMKAVAFFVHEPPKRPTRPVAPLVWPVNLA